MFNASDRIKQYNALWREANAMYGDWAKKHGLSYYELLVVLSLTEADGVCKQKDICAQWLLPKQTVNTILKNFLSRGWVELTPCGADRRNKAIHLTGSGRESLGAVAAELQEHECSVLSKLGEERAGELIRITSLYNTFFKGD
ncbi:MarR family winged helix-turn-helix transcriptional regulator [Bacilliculturomica massiliensis]|uniref:MarR family winged helix-turn-helix transcriptional regulator n=1 Tax=Bacilliculturomica massiliensis TaxID=1917867 RepID=UPI00103199B0|nr:MarR family winged helix-turn-helix transcriptional regulator [Bacilliculturomica massiliensis]